MPDAGIIHQDVQGGQFAGKRLTGDFIGDIQNPEFRLAARRLDLPDRSQAMFGVNIDNNDSGPCGCEGRGNGGSNP
jgi:hypothetical protein